MMRKGSAFLAMVVVGVGHAALGCGAILGLEDRTLDPCQDGAKSAGESDVDCGAGCPAKCANGKACETSSDCASGSCTDGKCGDCPGGQCGTCPSGTCVPLDIFLYGHTEQGPRVTSMPAGIDCTALPDGSAQGTCQAQFDQGSAVELTTDPGPEAVFAGWFGDINGCPLHGKCSVEMSAATALFPSFFAAKEASELRSFGGPNNIDALTAVGVRPSGGYVVAGAFEGTASFGAESVGASGAAFVAAFVGAYDAGGTTAAWKTLFTGSEAVILPAAVAITKRGAVFVGGLFSGALAWPGGSLSSAGGFDGFVARLDAKTGSVSWVKRLSSPGNDGILGVAAVGEDVVIGGVYDSSAKLAETTMLPATGKEWNPLVARLLAADGAVKWKTGGGPTGYGGIEGVAFDAKNRVFAVGYAGGGKLAFDTIEIEAAENKSDEALVVALDAETGAAMAATLFGGPDWDTAHAVAVGAGGDVFVTGTFRDEVQVGSTSLLSLGKDDLFVVGLTPSLALKWASSYGTPLFDAGLDISVVPGATGAGFLAVGGYVRRIPENVEEPTGAALESDAVVLLMLESDGSTPQAYELGGPGGTRENVHGITLTARGGAIGEVLVVGELDALDFGSGPFPGTQGHDGFFARLRL